MANDKKVTVDQLRELARRSDERFIDEQELGQALNSCKYKLTNSDSVVDVYGDGYAYRVTINADFTNYVSHICSGRTIWFDLSSVLSSTTLVGVTGFKVSAENGGYVLRGDCTSMDVWYEFTLRSTTWPSS